MGDRSTAAVARADALLQSEVAKHGDWWLRYEPTYDMCPEAPACPWWYAGLEWVREVLTAHVRLQASKSGEAFARDIRSKLVDLARHVHDGTLVHYDRALVDRQNLARAAYALRHPDEPSEQVIFDAAKNRQFFEEFIEEELRVYVADEVSLAYLRVRARRKGRPKPKTTAFGKSLGWLRDYWSLSYEEFAEDIGTDATTLKLYVYGSRTPNPKNKRKIAAKLGIPAADLDMGRLPETPARPKRNESATKAQR